MCEPSRPLGLYVHVPFCSARCTYCDFPTVAGRDRMTGPYLDALVREIEAFQDDLPGEADTVFFGGGTPSRLDAGALARVLSAIRRRFHLDSGAEVTLEANPETLDLERLVFFRAAGVTRISIGVQSLDDTVLRRVGRAHDAARAKAAVAKARAAGYGTVSVDLILGLPGERLERWGATVRSVARLDPDHVSVYLLETDKDAPLSRDVRAGRVPIADDDRLAEAYEETVQVLEAEGLRQYEISNFAREGHRSRHNSKYWTDAPYAGFGNGAHGYIGGVRRSNHRGLDAYVDAVTSGRSPIDWSEPASPLRRLEEALFLGLRLVDGVDTSALASRYGIDLRERWREAWERAGAAGLTEWDGDRVRLTAAGRLRSNELFSEIVT